MLRGIHKASTNWIGRAVMGVVMGLLVFSFGIWGIGDMLRRLGHSTDVATIGDASISVDQFRQRFNDQLQQLSSQLGRAVSPEQARAFGLDRQLLTQLLAQSALDQEADRMRLGMSQAQVARQVADDPAFRGPNGRFDQSRFEALIRQAGYTESRFMAAQRRVLLRRQLIGSLTGNITPPAAERDALHRYQDEQRSIDYVTLGPDQAGTLAPAADDVLRKYFNDHKELFRAPEYRKLAVLTLTPEALAPTIKVSPADVRQAYDSHKDRYSTPEKREIEQIMFPTAAAAAQAADKLAHGLSFSQLARERGLSAKDADLGLLAKADMVDPAVADAAFALQDGASSGPVAGQFGTVIVHVSKIVPAATKSFAAVAGQIEHGLARDRARQEISKRRDAIEDDLASGMRLDEVAKKLNLPARVIDAVDRSGRGPDGQPIAGLPKGVDLIGSAFASDVGNDNDALQLPGGGYAWFDVLAVTPAHDRAFDKVKDSVARHWRDDEIASRLKRKAAALVDKLKAGARLADLAAADKLAIRQATGLKREGSSGGLPPAVVADVFRTAKGGAASVTGKAPTDRIVFRVTDVVVPPFDAKSADARQGSKALRGAMADDILGEYVSRVETNLGVSVNQAGLDEAEGLGSGAGNP